MRIAVIGAGAVGAGIGRAWLAAGHDVHWGVPDPSKYPELPKERVTMPAPAADGADVILLAVPWNAAESAINQLGTLDGKLLIDATNPLAAGAQGLGLAIGFDTSGGEQVAKWARGAKVVKTLNQTGAENMADARRYACPPVMFVAGDDPRAKEVATTLVKDLGFEALDAGPLSRARLLEPYAMLWIEQALKLGLGRDFALTIERPHASAARASLA